METTTATDVVAGEAGSNFLSQMYLSNPILLYAIIAAITLLIMYLIVRD